MMLWFQVAELCCSHRYACGQGLALLHVNPVLADGTAGLATSATAFAAIEVGWMLMVATCPCL